MPTCSTTVRAWLVQLMVDVGDETAVSRPKALFKLLSEHQMYRLSHWRPKQVTPAQVARLSPAIVRVLAEDAEARNWWQADAPVYTEQGDPVKRWISLSWLLHGQ